MLLNMIVSSWIRCFNLGSRLFGTIFHSTRTCACTTILALGPDLYVPSCRPPSEDGPNASAVVKLDSKSLESTGFGVPVLDEEPPRSAGIWSTFKSSRSFLRLAAASMAAGSRRWLEPSIGRRTSRSSVVAVRETRFRSRAEKTAPTSSFSWDCNKSYRQLLKNPNAEVRELCAASKKSRPRDREEIAHTYLSEELTKLVTVESNPFQFLESCARLLNHASPNSLKLWPRMVP